MTSQHPDLHHLTNSDLLEQTKLCVKEERRIGMNVLHHLLEISTRLLYKELGFSSIQTYCVHELNYSVNTANQLISAMNLLTDIPEIEKKIEQGSLSMATVSRIQKICKAQEKVNDHKVDLKIKTDLIGAVEGKSRKEAETILKSLYPKTSVLNPGIERKAVQIKNEIKVTLNDALMAKLERVKELSEQKQLRSNYAELIDWLAESYLEIVESPHKTKKTARKKLPGALKAKLELSQQKKLPLGKVRMRRKNISASTTRRVWEKANGQCCYLSPVTGRRCSERGGLEIEHVVPVSQGGSDDPSNLLLFCKDHSLHSTIKKISQDQMRKFIEKLRVDEYRLDQGN